MIKGTTDQQEKALSALVEQIQKISVQDAQQQGLDNQSNLEKVRLNGLKQMLQMQVTNQNNLALLMNLLQQLQSGLINQKALESKFTESFQMTVQQGINFIRNEHGQTALQHSLQNNDFITAYTLVHDQKAHFGSEEKAILSVALESNTPVTRNFSSRDIQVKQTNDLHTIKEYGLTLGIVATAQDGTFSQYAHIGPTNTLITQSFEDFNQSVDNINPNKDKYVAISESMTFSNNAAKYNGSEASAEGAKQIADRAQSGKLTTIPMNCQGHAMGMTFIPDENGKGGYLSVTNRGIGCEPGNAGTDIYRVEDSSKINQAFVDSMMNGHNNGTPHDTIMNKIKQIVDTKEPIHHIEQSAQKRDNCTIANTRANIQGVLLCQEAVKQNKAPSQINQEHIKSAYKDFTGHMRSTQVKKLATALRNKPNDPDLNKLAHSYLEQHSQVNSHGDFKDQKYRELLNSALLSNNMDLQSTSQTTYFNEKSSKQQSLKQQVGGTSLNAGDKADENKSNTKNRL